MKHILFISHARGLHGAEAVMVQAVKACAAYGARVTVVVPSIVPEEGLEKALEGIRGVQILPMPYRAAGGDMLRTKLVRIYNIPTLLRLKRFVKREQVDVIYSNTSITILGVELANRTHVRHIWHWHEPVDEQFGWHETMVDAYREWVLDSSTIVCISKQQKQEWEETLGMPLKRARIIYNPIKRIDAIPVNRYAFHRGARFGFVGHFEPRKNLELLIGAFEYVHEQKPETRLSLLGAVNENDRLYVENLTDLKAPVVEIVSQTPDVAKFYSQIDILVLPSWRETMPLVVLEAMQAGVCVLQTNRSGMSELLEDGKETLFFAPDQPEELVELMQRCLEPTYRQQIAEAGQRKAMQLVNEQCFDQQIQDLLCK